MRALPALWPSSGEALLWRGPHETPMAQASGVGDLAQVPTVQLPELDELPGLPREGVVIG